MIPILEDAIWMGIAAGFFAMMGQIRRSELYFYPAGVLICLALGIHRAVIAQVWMWDSLARDVPWMSGLLVGFWLFQARSGWVRLSGWLPTVVIAALFGDLLVATALVAGEADPQRRARLVLAASGASLIGRASGAALCLGWGGPGVMALGVLLAMSGYTPGPFHISVQRPAWKDAWPGILVGLCGAVLVWICTVGNLLEILASQLEGTAAAFPGKERWITTGIGLATGILAEEALGGIASKELLYRALALKGDWARQSLLTGLSVGGGLPLLLLSRSGLKTGIPLWLLQVGILAAWIWWR